MKKVYAFARLMKIGWLSTGLRKQKAGYPVLGLRQSAFTLVELLIVIAIIGVLAAIIVPNVVGLVGSGENEAASSELAVVQSAMDIMMAKNGLSSVTATSATSDMSAFPSGNPLYPAYLRLASTRSTYSCTSSGLVLRAAGQTTSTTSSTTSTSTTTTTTTSTTSTTTSTTTTTPPAYPAWQYNTAYQPNSYVTHNGGVFYARHYASENQVPGEISSPWQEVTTEWRNFNIYEAGVRVWYNGVQFESRYWTQNNTPGLISSPWQELTDQWRDFNVYHTNDVVIYNGHQYRARYYSQNIVPGTSDAWELIS